MRTLTEFEIDEAEEKTRLFLGGLSENEITDLKTWCINKYEKDDDTFGYFLWMIEDWHEIDWLTLQIASEEVIRPFYNCLWNEQYQSLRRYNSLRTGGNKWQRNYRAWRKRVFERDNYKCMICGTNKDLHAHHINSRKEYPELEFDVDNGKTLCKMCHAKQHKDIACFINTSRQKGVIMPRGNGTGPAGKGPRTGRGKGGCPPKR